MGAIFWICLLVLVLSGLLVLMRPRVGLIVSLLVSGVIFFWGIAEESLVLVCLSPLFLLIILIFVITLKVLRRQPLIVQRGLCWWVILGIPLVVLLCLALVIFQIPWLILFLWLAVTWIVSAAIYATTNHWWTNLQVFSLLGAAMRQNLPLTVALENAASGRHDYLGSVFREIHAWLIQGYNLAEALDRGYPQCPRHHLALVKVAQKSQQMPQAFAMIERDLQASSRWRNLVDTDPGSYPLVILIILYFQMMGLITFVMPQFKAVLEEMMGGMDVMPWPTRILLDLQIADFSLMQCIGFVLVAIVVMRFIKWLRPRSIGARGWLGPLIDRFRWSIPGVGQLERTLGLLQITGVLRLGLKGGQTIDQAVGHTLDLNVNAVLKRRLKRWHAAVLSGEPVARAARRCHLGRGLAWAFDTDFNAGQTPLILHSLEDLLRARHRYLSVVLRSILNPCIIIALSLVVGFVVLAFFLPGVKVIAVMSELVYP